MAGGAREERRANPGISKRGPGRGEHPAVGVCWNSNASDLEDGSVAKNFELLRPWIEHCHITELWNPDYPYRELFSLLQASGYQGYTMAEIPESSEPERLMRYYRALWLE